MIDTDPTGSGGVVPGFSNQRQLELLVEPVKLLDSVRGRAGLW
jgi:hypothetical protein